MVSGNRVSNHARLGTLSTEILARLGGVGEVDRAIEEPPRGAGFLLSPFARLQDEEPPSLQAPAPVGAESWRDDGSLGALFWYLALEARLGPVAALSAADLISADAYVMVDRAGATCVRDDVIAALLAEYQSRESMWLAIAPEGTRSWVPHLKSGFYHLCVEGQLPCALGFIDYGTRTVGIERYVYFSGDVEKDLQMLREYYAAKRGRRQELAGAIQFKDAR